MKRTNPNSYPVTFQFEQYLLDNGVLVYTGTETGGYYFQLAERDTMQKVIAITAERLHEMLGEYEHGTVDWNIVLEMVGMRVEAEWIKKYYHAAIKAEGEDATAEALQYRALSILRVIYEDIIATMING